MHRRDGALGVHSIDHFALAVPDLAEARHFYAVSYTHLTLPTNREV